MSSAHLSAWIATSMLIVVPGCTNDLGSGPPQDAGSPPMGADAGAPDEPASGLDGGPRAPRDGGSRMPDAQQADAGRDLPDAGDDDPETDPETDPDPMNPEPCTPGAGTTPVGADAILDNATCLMWEAEPGFLGRGNWEPAATYCDGLTAGGFDDWRMPTVEELTSLPLSDIPWIGRAGTAPRYVPTGATDLGNFHYCGITHWDPSGSLGCGWVGPGNTDGTICVRGTAAVALPPPSGCNCEDGHDGYSPRSE